ncbi:MAG: carboxylating nicotinate-nucleotide diphosphorylase [Planctomycetota bacterium]|nr:carboxylating nicotinate-nucleotide diphosphorylase [Planctomycetota bacterium]
MFGEFEQTTWDAATIEASRRLVEWSIDEDLCGGRDLTCEAMVPPEATGAALVVARQLGIVAGLPIVPLVLTAVQASGIRGVVEWQPNAVDQQSVVVGQSLGRLVGNARAILAAERTLLNFIGRLSGIATETRRYVDAVRGHVARIYDTRKTTPGWRRLEKYAVRCGGGCNHRLGLYAAVMIKDNHLMLSAHMSGDNRHSPANAVRLAQGFLKQSALGKSDPVLLEVELDGLEPFSEVLAVGPDIVLLDNMPLQQLQQAVLLRNQVNPQVQLEASGGINLKNVAAVAATGVDRISIGALTHSSPGWDVALDWE